MISGPGKRVRRSWDWLISLGLWWDVYIKMLERMVYIVQILVYPVMKCEMSITDLCCFKR
jgi:hypothetical protein